MSRQVAEEWLEPLDWIETSTPVDALISDTSVEETSERRVAARSPLLARLRSATELPHLVRVGPAGTETVAQAPAGS